jgi:hypothetical protein
MACDGNRTERRHKLYGQRVLLRRPRGNHRFHGDWGTQLDASEFLVFDAARGVMGSHRVSVVSLRPE